MSPYLRYSPVSFTSRPMHKEVCAGWQVILEYQDKGGGPFLIDLSHFLKWDVQDAELSRIEPWGPMIPESPGDCSLKGGILVGRLNRTQGMVWHLLGERRAVPEKSAFTDVTDAFALLALLGSDVFSIMEKVTALDLRSPKKKPPFLLQGPVLNIPTRVVVLWQKEGTAALLIACARGYGQSLADALLDAGATWGLRPAGENAFSHGLKA